MVSKHLRRAALDTVVKGIPLRKSRGSAVGWFEFSGLNFRSSAALRQPRAAPTAHCGLGCWGRHFLSLGGEGPALHLSQKRHELLHRDRASLNSPLWALSSLPLVPSGEFQMQWGGQSGRILVRGATAMWVGSTSQRIS